MAIFGHPKFGATGKFPKGRLDESDEGALRFGITVVGNAIRIEFGKQVSWMGLYAEDARAFAEALLRAADEAEGEAN